MATAPHLLLVMLLLFAASPAPSVADMFVVGDKQHWAPNVNYTVWADQYHFHVGDWLSIYLPRRPLFFPRLPYLVVHSTFGLICLLGDLRIKKKKMCAVFNYKKDMFDVVQVSETAYAACDASNPIVSYNRGSRFPFELNHTGRFYFICSRGYCWNGMKVSVLVEPRSPPPSVAPSTNASHASSARAASGVWWALAASLAAAVLGLSFVV